MRHLDTAVMRDLADREPEAVAWFREHLASPCEACETFLATHTDPLDGRVDALLLQLAPADAAAEEDTAPVIPLRRPAPPRRFAAPPARYWGWMAGALAASVVMVVMVPLVKGPGAPLDLSPENLKGSGRISLELAVVARGVDGGLRRLDPGAAVSKDEVLLVRYHATESGTALLYQQRENQPPELLGHFPLEAGTHDLAGPEGLAGVSLETDEGPLALVLVAFAAWEPATEADALAALGTDEASDSRPGTVSRFDVRVQTGQTSRQP